MSEPRDLYAALRLEPAIPPSPTSQPLGTSFLPGHDLGSGQDLGVDLAALGYLEREWIVHGLADELSYDAAGRAVTSAPAVPFTTRLLTRFPADPSRFSGAVQLEPNHPDADRSLSWGALAPWIVRRGHAHVGVTQHPATVAELQRFDPARYGGLDIPRSGMRFDLLGQIAVLIAGGGAASPLAGYDVAQVYASGWSMTGTFWRTYLGESFDERWRRAEGSPAIDGYVICISSGGASRAGYALLSEESSLLPLGDARRRIGAHGVPVVELLSELESETHAAVLRDDSDGPDDAYRLYQVAGTSHVATGFRGLLTNGEQLRARGFPAFGREILERPSRARLDFVARAVFEHLHRWVAEGTPAPRGERFGYRDEREGGVRGLFEEAWPLRRDDDGNVEGGVRTPWGDVPLGAYLPHSRPAPGSCQPAPAAPYSDPAMLADLIGHLEPFPASQLRARYGTLDAYVARYAARAGELEAASWLLPEEAATLIAAAGDEADLWVR